MPPRSRTRAVWTAKGAKGSERREAELQAAMPPPQSSTLAGGPRQAAARMRLLAAIKFGG